jgi:small subunit ribosomal protein S6
MKQYELTYLITPDITEEQAKDFQNKVITSLQEEGGILTEAGVIFKKKLAYPIKKNLQAYLAVLTFQLDAGKLANLEKNLKAESQILRYIILTKTPVKEKLVRIKKAPPPKEKKVELKEIEKKLEEILDESK